MIDFYIQGYEEMDIEEFDFLDFYTRFDRAYQIWKLFYDSFIEATDSEQPGSKTDWPFSGQEARTLFNQIERELDPAAIKLFEQKYEEDQGCGFDREGL